MAKPKYEEWLTPDGLLVIEGWARDGLTDEQIAKNMGVSLSSLGAWKRDHPPILSALKKGRRPVDLEVENALLKRAMGYEYDEVSTETIKYPDGNKEVRSKVVRKMVLPDTTAQIFWLKNRRPDKWRDKPEPSQEEALKVAAEILRDIKGVIK